MGISLAADLKDDEKQALQELTSKDNSNYKDIHKVGVLFHRV